LGDGFLILPFSSWLRYAFETASPVASSTSRRESPLGHTQIGEQGAEVGGMPHELGALASGSLAAISHLFSIAESLDRSSGLRYRLIE
jgi:hypothetical protein